MKLHIEISKEKRLEIKQNLKKFMLMSGKYVCIILSAEFTEEEVKGTWFNRSTKKIFLTEMTICAYNPIAKCSGTFSEESSFEDFVLYTSFYNGRQKWDDLKEMLKVFGVELVPIKTIIGSSEE
jgi:hypothetical protein